MEQVTVAEAQERLTDLLTAASNGETVIIVGADEEEFQLIPLNSRGQYLEFGSARGLISMADDFDEPLDEFKEYME